jgi:uncharacterized protein
LTGRVVDQANVLPPDAEARITQRLEAHEAASGQQFAVLTVPSLQGDPLEDYSIRVVESWKLGQKKQDNGLLLLVVPNDRKVRVEVGYGLEGTITDALSSQIIRNVIKPAFKAGNYAAGIEGALEPLMKAGAGETPAIPEVAPADEGGTVGGFSPLSLLVAGVVAVYVAMVVFSSTRGSSRRRRRGFGGFYVGGGGFSDGGWSGGGSGFGGGDSGGGFSGGGGGFGGGGSSDSW